MVRWFALAAVIVAFGAVPASANAAAALRVKTGYLHIGQPSDADSENDGTTTYQELDAVEYRVTITNRATHGADSAAANLRLRVTYSDYLFAFRPLNGNVAVVGGGGVGVGTCSTVASEDDFDTMELVCDLTGTLAVDAEVTLSIPLELRQADWQALEDEVGPVSVGFSARASNSPTTDVFTETTSVADLPDFACTGGSDEFSGDWYSFQTLPRSLADVNLQGHTVLPISCTYATDDELDVSVIGDPSNMTLTADPAGPEPASARWSPPGQPLTQGIGALYQFRLVADNGMTLTAAAQFVALENVDVSTLVSGPVLQSVSSEGTEAVYTAVVTNRGPQPAMSSSVNWTVGSTAVIGAATDAGARTTCDTERETAVVYVDCYEGGPIPVGGSRTFTLTVRLIPGQRNLTVPSSLTVKAYGSGGGATYYVEDFDWSNNESQFVSQLVAAPTPTCAPGQTGTFPECVTPPLQACPRGQIGDLPVCTPKPGTPGSDGIVGLAGRDLIRAGSGNDTVRGENGNDELHGDVGDDKLFGGLGIDKLFGGSGRDVLDGGPGNDLLHGNADNDRLIGGPGNDVLSGDIGNDKISCGTGTDKALGGTGFDAIDCRDGRGGDTINGGRGRDSCIGDKRDKFIACEKIVRK